MLLTPESGLPADRLLCMPFLVPTGSSSNGSLGGSRANLRHGGVLMVLVPTPFPTRERIVPHDTRRPDETPDIARVISVRCYWFSLQNDSPK